VDAVFAHIILRKLNEDSLNLYETHVKNTKEIHTLSDVMELLEQTQLHFLFSTGE